MKNPKSKIQNPPQKRQTSPKSSEKPRILIVDDDESTCKSLSLIFSKKGYQTETAMTGREALELATRLTFNLAFLDIKLPDMQGVDLMTPLKEINSDMAIILATAYASLDTAVKALDKGASAYITKPLNMDEVLATVKGAIEKQRLVIENKHLVQSLQKELSERKQAENNLRESEERYRKAIEHSNDGVSIINGDIHVFVNQKYADIFGYGRPEEIVGRPLSVIVHPDDRKRITDITIRRQRGESVPSRYECKGILKNGAAIYLEISATRTTNNGEPVSLAYVRDVTDRMRVEMQLRQAQKMEAMGALAGGIAHDFNNILSAIMGYAELTETAIAKGHKARKTLAQVLKASYRAKDLVKQILAFSYYSKEEKKPTNVSLVVKEVLKLLRSTLPTTIQIHFETNTDNDIIMADPTQIHQILMNLCINAHHAMRKEGGILKISLNDVNLGSEETAAYIDLTPGLYLKLSVSDTGHGMAPDLMEHIFNPYFTTKEKGVGTGMGLAVVHGIIKSYGGAIKVRSEPGQGTVFNLFLPGVEKGNELETETIEPPLRGSERILFVDDEETLVDLGVRMLQHLGYNVDGRSSSVEALKFFKERADKFDLVIMDQTMPQMTGEKLAGELMTIKPDIPIILCTGYSELITEEQAKAMGIKAFVMKPIVMREIARTIRQVLDS